MIYLAWIIDYFYDARELIGVYSSEEEAEKAIDIVLKHAKEADPDNTPDSRYDWCWEEVRLDGFNENSLYIFANG